MTVEREPQLEPPNLLHRDRFDPGLVKAFAFSALAHVVVIAALLIAGTVAHRALKPATTYSVGLVNLESGSPLLDLGPLGDAKAPRENVFGAPAAPATPPAVVAPPTAVKTVEPTPAPKLEPKVEAAPPPPKPEPKPEVKPPEPKPSPKVEAKPTPKPEPKPEAKPTPKVEAKPKPPAKPEPKAAPKPESKPESKPPPAKTTAAAKPEAKAETKPAAATAAAKASATEKSAATTSTPSGAVGQTDIAKATGPGSGGGGGFGGTGPGGGPAGGELRSPEFVSYFEHIKRTIRRGWVWQTADPNIRTTVGFAVLADGRLANIRSVESSGDARFDLSVLNAVRAAQGQLGPPPEQFQKDFSDVQIVFRPQDMAE